MFRFNAVVKLLTSVGALVRFLPAYSPDINPNEEVKHYLQANNILFDSSMTPTAIILQAFNSVSTQNCQSYNDILNQYDCATEPFVNV